jgi:putative transcriptional regulator
LELKSCFIKKNAALLAQRKRTMVNYEIKNGIVLLAEPFMLDPNFRRAAVLLCEHSPEGSMGFIMNRPTDLRVDELIDGFPEFAAPVFEGGPVQMDTIHYVHNVGSILDESHQIMEGIYWGGDFDKLKFLIRSELVKPENIRFFMGYAGWDEGQLLDEMTIGSWVLAEMHHNYLFKSRPEVLWQQVMYNKGDAYSVIAYMPDAPNWN